MFKNLLSLLSNRIKLEILFLFSLSFIVAFLEVVSIGSIPIFLMYMMDPANLIDKIPLDFVKEFLQNYLSSADIITNLKLVLFLLFIIFLIKNLIILFNSVYQAFFNRRISTLLASGLFNKYLSEDYLFFINNKPSELIKNIESIGIVRSLITMILVSTKEILTIIGLIIIIGISDIKISLIMILLGIIFMIIHKYKIAGMLISYGKKSYKYTESRLSLINDFFGSIIDIKITNKEKFFSKLFKHYFWSYESARIIDKLVTSMVRPTVEMTSVIIMILVIILFSIEGKTFIEIIPLIALLSLSFIRILPSVVTLLNTLNRIKFETNQLKYLLKNINLSEKNFENDENKRVINFKEKIQIRDLSFSYPEKKVKNIKNINLTINKGDIIGIIGKSGSGKTTLLNNISNLLKFEGGEIIFDDIKIKPKESFIINNLSYIRQDIYLLNDTIEKNVLFGEDQVENNNTEIKNSLVRAGLEKYKNKLELIIGHKGSRISGGENQLLGLARAIYRNPKIIFLDEPTSNLDYKTQENYLETIKNLGITTILIAHRREALDICNKILLMNDGTITDQGSLNYFKDKYSNFETYIN
ncbi:ABC transporter ATP-binding protein/permease [Candidatus Pelagibacter sp.]|nr:ABC transporter ATP-binding protein/permease [Candidatus Pelagibacter sp.]